MPTVVSPERVRLDEDLGSDKAAVLGVLADIAGDHRTPDTSAVASEVVARAEAVTAAVPDGVALLAAQSPAVESPTVAFARLTSLVDLGSADRPADLVILVISPEGDTSHHDLLARITHALDNSELSEALRDARTPADAAGLVERALTPTAAGQSWGGRARQVLMTGVSYMIPFVAGGGLLIALGYLLGGYDISGAAQDIVTGYDAAHLPDPAELGLSHVAFDSPAMAYVGALLYTVGATAFTLFVPAMAGYIAFAIADRPGIAPGFVMGALAVDLVGFGLAQSGFLGAIVGGAMAGVVARWVGRWNVPAWAGGLMPVVLIPMVATGVSGVVMIAVLNRPLATVTRSAMTSLESLSEGSLVVLGVVLGLMMAFDIGGPLNKTAYTFAVAGVSGAAAMSADAAQLNVMAAVMLAGMTPPLALAVATRVRPRLFSSHERESGKAAAALGAVFITEGAIPFAAVDPVRVIPAIMAGSAVTGGLTMALDVTSQAPHGGVLVLFLVENLAGAALAVLAGITVTVLLVCAFKSRRA